MLLTNLKDKRLEVIKPVEDLINKFDLWLAGGAARSIYSAEKPKDYDIFLSSTQNEDEVRDWLKRRGWEEVFVCEKRELFSFRKDDLKLQIVNKRKYVNSFDLIGSFDFTCTMFAYSTEGLRTTKQAVKHTKNRQVRINTVEFPVATMARMIRYANKGYWITPDAILQFVEIVNTSEFDGEHLALYID